MCIGGKPFTKATSYWQLKYLFYLRLHLVLGWKLPFSLYCNHFWGSKKNNLSAITPANRNWSGPDRVCYTCTGQGTTTCRKLWARSDHWGQYWGSDVSAFFGAVYKALLWQLSNDQICLRNMNPCPLQNIRTGFPKMFSLGVICPQNLKIEGIKRVLKSSYKGHIAEILTPSCSPRARKFARFGQLFCTTYGYAATGRQDFPIFAFLPIFPIKMP